MNTPRKVRICVAEDEPKILQNIVKKITMSGDDYVVVATARNGVDALHQIVKEEPDVLITDIVMPMMDGLALLAEARTTYPLMHVVVVSGHDDFTYAKQAIQHGVDDYLLKPLKIEPLREILSKIRDRLHADRNETARDELFRLVHGTLSPVISVNPTFADVRFQAAIVCIGNVYPPRSDRVIDEEIAAFLARGWMRAADKMKQCWIIDDDAPNRKFLIFESSAVRTAIDTGGEKSIFKAISESFPGTPVTLV